MDSGAEKVKQICDVLKHKTLVPAQEEAGRIIEEAKAEADKIVANAKAEAKAQIEAAKKKMADEQAVLETSLRLAAKQATAALKSDLETTFFNPTLTELISSEMKGASFVANLLSALVSAVEKEGMGAELKAIIGAQVDKEAAAKSLAANLLDKLKGGLTVGSFVGGVQLKLVNESLTVEVTEEVVGHLLAAYLRDDFRKVVLG